MNIFQTNSIPENNLLEIGVDVIPTLEISWENSESALQKERLAELLKKIRFDN